MADLGQTPCRRRDPFRTARSGITLFQTIVATAVIGFAIVSSSAASISVSEMRQERREREIAEEAARSLAEDILEIGRRELGNRGSWSRRVVESVCRPDALGTAFDVAGLRPQAGLAHVGSITFVVDETRTDDELGVVLGLPRDLDGDGYASRCNVLETARFLPAVVELRWRGVRGDERLLHPFVVVGY